MTAEPIVFPCRVTKRPRRLGPGRQHHVDLWLTKAEYQRLASASVAQGLTRSQVLRRFIRGLS